MYARGYWLYKRSDCEDRSTQTVDVQVASSLRFEEELTVERSSASSDLFADRTIVWVTSGGRCYHKPGCRWTLRGHIEMTESAAILANYQTCHSFGKRKFLAGYSGDDEFGGHCCLWRILSRSGFHMRVDEQHCEKNSVLVSGQ